MRAAPAKYRKATSYVRSLAARVACPVLRLLLLPIALSGLTMAAAEVDPAYFAARLYPVLEAAQCRMCHARDGVASATRLHFPEKEAPAGADPAFRTFARAAGRSHRIRPSRCCAISRPIACGIRAANG